MTLSVLIVKAMTSRKYSLHPLLSSAEDYLASRQPAAEEKNDVILPPVLMEAPVEETDSRAHLGLDKTTLIQPVKHWLYSFTEYKKTATEKERLGRKENENSHFLNRHHLLYGFLLRSMRDERRTSFSDDNCLRQLSL